MSMEPVTLKAWVTEHCVKKHSGDKPPDYLTMTLKIYEDCVIARYYQGGRYRRSATWLDGLQTRNGKPVTFDYFFSYAYEKERHIIEDENNPVEKPDRK